MRARGLLFSIVMLAALCVTGGAQASSLMGLERVALAKLAHAPVSATTKAAARVEIARAAHLVRTLPNGRGYHVAVALQEAAFFPAALTQPRALALYGALRANDDYFAKHWAPADKTDIAGSDGVVYRYFGGHCFRFHPLANFGALNAFANAGDAEGTQELADALVARGVYQRGGGIAWEYDFPFNGGRAPWLSGMAQAVAAQAFARAAHVVPERAFAYTRDAAAAYRIIPRHLLANTPNGPWIKLYAFSGLEVLNAQLQAAISIGAYADDTGDDAAAALATRMRNAAATLLPRFDTGYWSYYALPHEPSPVDYHHYVVQLLARLAATDARFASAAKRFAGYEKEPPAFRLANGGVGQVVFWLSKPASVTVTSAAGPTRRLSLLDGWHSVIYAPRTGGIFPVHVSAVDWHGNRAAFDTLPIVHVGKGSAPPPAAASPDTVAEPRFVIDTRAEAVWPDGATTADPTLVASLNTVPFSAGLTLELDAATPPSSAYAQYAADLAAHAGTLRAIAVGPAPTAATAAQYAATVAAVRDAVHAVAPSVAVDALVNSGADAPSVLAAVATVADAILYSAGATALPDTPVLLDRPTLAAVQAAACSENVVGVVLDPGASDPALAAAVQEARRGSRVCPGWSPAPAVQNGTVAFPQTVVSKQRPAVTVGCRRDCLYVATLVGADGRVVSAKRGALRGGFPPLAVLLPASTLAQSSYSIDLQIENRVNPGPVLRVWSGSIPRG